MKLKQYKEKKNHKKLIVIGLVIIALIGGVAIGITFANFKVQKSFKVMEGNFIYEGSGDVIFAFYKDNNQKVTNIPTIEEGYVYERNECSNNASIEWDSKKQSPIVNNLKRSGTKCDLYFKKISSSSTTVSSDYNALADLIDTKSGQLVYDLTPDRNLRFVGEKPDNYVSFNNDYIWRGYYTSSTSSSYKEYNSYEECTSASSFNYICEQIPAWRIIGVINNIEDENGVIGSHLKIVRNTSIGEYSWDSSESSVNDGCGVNEWSEADIQKVLNENYYNKEAGGTCYGGKEETVKDCPDWERFGLNEEARSMVSKIKWDTGVRDTSYRYLGDGISAYSLYEMERSDYLSQPQWEGYVGLPYGSDILLSTSGEKLAKDISIGICYSASLTLYNTRLIYNSSNDIMCSYFSWFHNSSGPNAWTMTPNPTKGTPYGSYVHTDMNRGSPLSDNIAAITRNILPVVYLNSNVKVSGQGTASSPYTLSV